MRHRGSLPTIGLAEALGPAPPAVPRPLRDTTCVFIAPSSLLLCTVTEGDALPTASRGPGLVAVLRGSVRWAAGYATGRGSRFAGLECRRVTLDDERARGGDNNGL